MPHASDPSKTERRSNLALRILIDDMLARVRDLNRDSTVLAPEELARAEAELEAVMARVRRAAAADHSS